MHNTITKNTMGKIALYIHIPFCKRKCHYCSFVSCAGRESDIPLYIECISKELCARLHNETICSIYFGGGTPSLVPAPDLALLMNTINSLSNLENNAEITLEANPATFDKAYLTEIKGLGINRLSIGVQSFNDDELRFLGRIHNSSQAIEAFGQARDAGFDNVNLDLIYGIPGQSTASWKSTLRQAIALNPEHISLYPLTIEENTPLWQMVQCKEVDAPDPDTAADQYELAEDILQAAGYEHYEISNWSKPGFECRHNITYWKCRPYIGIGVAAHSYINGHRLANTNDMDKYISALSKGNFNIADIQEMDEEIDSELQLSEAVIMGLRLCNGISVNDISTRFGIDLKQNRKEQIEEMENSGMLQLDSDMMRLTRRGRLLGNEVFQRFLPV